MTLHILFQIERFAAQILDEEVNRKESDPTKLSPEEFVFAKA